MDVADVQARTRARRRLIGAAVLLLVGVVSFPLLFESQPRPLAVDTPMVIPARDGAAPLAMPGKAAGDRSASGAVVIAPSAASVPGGEPVATHNAAAPPTAPAPTAGTVTAAPPAVAPAQVPPAAPAVAQPAPKAEPKAEPKAAPAPKPETKAAASPKADVVPPPKPAPKAETKAETKAEAKSDTKGAARVVVQIGAYAEEATVKDVRQRAERLGFKTFTQEVQTPNGRRIRVRIGPFENSADAQKAVERLKGAKLPGVVLTL